MLLELSPQEAKWVFRWGLLSDHDRTGESCKKDCPQCLLVIRLAKEMTKVAVR